jgi:hypothetical protein
MKLIMMDRKEPPSGAGGSWQFAETRMPQLSLLSDADGLGGSAGIVPVMQRPVLEDQVVVVVHGDVEVMG